MEFCENCDKNKLEVTGGIENGKQFDLEITLPEDNRDAVFGILKDNYGEPVRDAVIKLVEIVNLYQDAIDSCQKQQFGKVSHDLMAQLKKLTPEVEYYHSFMFDNTVYKIDDVRKREENEKCK